MIEMIQHLFGMCPDHAGHLDLIDILLYGGFGWVLIFSKSYFYKIKSLTNRMRHRFMKEKKCDCDHE